MKNNIYKLRKYKFRILNSASLIVEHVAALWSSRSDYIRSLRWIMACTWQWKVMMNSRLLMKSVKQIIKLFSLKHMNAHQLFKYFSLCLFMQYWETFSAG